MNKFLQVKGTWEASYKKLLVVHGSWKPVVVQPRSVQRTLSDTTDKFHAKKYYVWGGVLRLPQSPTIGYAGVSDVIGWMGQNNGDCQLNFIDFFNNAYTAKADFDYDPESASPVLDGSQNFYYVPFIFKHDGSL